MDSANDRTADPAQRGGSEGLRGRPEPDGSNKRLKSEDARWKELCRAAGFGFSPTSLPACAA